MTKRAAEITRETSETKIRALLDIEGTGQAQISTGVGFLDHMLNLWTRHGLFDLTLSVRGDLEIDDHHTVEDTGLVLGQAVKQALDDKSGIKRYGTAFVPMDEALVQVSLDLSGRPYLALDVPLAPVRLGNFSAEMLEDFLRAFAFSAGITLHVRLICGRNTHHIIEAVFKALGRALDEATQLDPRIKGVMSTKGTL
ncbi:MAG TPA: imidazoleglycerol-phosphate dehydratase HisB [Firmicutes bacterium]|nr:imidazoleglycerol-phosphate dehydratase HisB [Bacillota bacterium]HWR57224.1 imidazoleglycerol-phosphate dehydratase HisB [Negativicutes bacterium]